MQEIASPSNVCAACPDHALITGGSAGIGLAVAEAFARSGYAVTITGRNLDRLDKACDRLSAYGGKVCIAQADTTDIGGLPAMFEKARAELGPISVLVNNAGDAASKSIAETSATVVRSMLEVNLVQVFECVRICLPTMLERAFGRIVNIASTAAVKGYPFTSAYCAAKHGVLGLTRSLALEVARSGITVNAICPGYTRTDLVARQLADLGARTGRDENQLLERLVASNPMGRLVEPDEVARVALFLASNAAASVTGQAIVVAGGEYMAG